MSIKQKNTKKEVLATLKPLFERAKKRDLLFYSPYHDIYFTVKELKAQHKENKFLWGAKNWRLVSKKMRLRALRAKLYCSNKTSESLQQEIEDLEIQK